MTPSDLKNLRADPSVTWINRDRYRLAGDPPWMTRSVPKQLKPEPEAPQERESAAGSDYERMAYYKGSPEYQAMLERNGGVAPGQKESRTTRESPSVYSGPQGGKYTKGVTKDGRPYRRYF